MGLAVSVGGMAYLQRRQAYALGLVWPRVQIGGEVWRGRYVRKTKPIQVRKLFEALDAVLTTERSGVESAAWVI
jgi:hypothetical protein